ncbi:MAG: protein kinase [Candidatus Eremiobacteraeota bacterium]|nr:protein kinase [Candidatus Eremiobacteraeota bacterium]
MGFRVPAPDGRKRENLPVLVLPEGTLLKGCYKISYLTMGGMSVVYKAVKGTMTYLIKEVEASDSQGVISLSQEKSTLERLDHPGIVKVFDFFGEEGFYYLVVEYIDGESLDKLVSPIRDVFLQEKVVLEWAMQLYDIFEYLHRQKPPIIYRDLKPQNIIKDRQGKVHLADFGIARVLKDAKTSDTSPMGTAITASPEHYGGRQTDARSDIFTIGATLHFLLTNGKHTGTLFEFPPLRTINPKVSENLEQVIRKATELEPEKRYQSIGEMRQAHLNTREAPLPVIEPFGKEKAPDEERGKGKPWGEPLARPPEKTSSANLTIFAVTAACFALIAGALMIAQNLFPKKPADIQAPPATVAMEATTPLPEPSPQESARKQNIVIKPSSLRTKAVNVIKAQGKKGPLAEKLRQALPAKDPQTAAPPPLSDPGSYPVANPGIYAPRTRRTPPPLPGTTGDSPGRDPQLTGASQGHRTEGVWALKTRDDGSTAAFSKEGGFSIIFPPETIEIPDMPTFTDKGIARGNRSFFCKADFYPLPQGIKVGELKKYHHKALQNCYPRLKILGIVEEPGGMVIADYLINRPDGDSMRVEEIVRSALRTGNIAVLSFGAVEKSFNSTEMEARKSVFFKSFTD